MSRTIRSRLLAGGAVALSAALLSGCAVGGNEAGAELSDGDVTLSINWWGASARDERTREAIALFEEEHPNISVEGQSTEWGGYWDKLATTVAGGDAPDVMQFDQLYLASYAQRGALADLGQLDEFLDTTVYPDAVIDQGRVGDELYGVPIGVGTVGVLVNRTVLDAAGVELPDAESWTWDDLSETALAVTEASDGGVHGISPFGGDMPSLTLWARQLGGDVYDKDGQVVLEQSALESYWEYALDQIESGAAPDASQLAEGSGVALDLSDIVTGRTALTFAPTSMLTAYEAAAPDTEFELLPLPTAEDADPGFQYLKPSMYWTVSSTSDHPAEAALLLDFLTADPRVAAIFGTERGMPANPSSLETIEADFSPADQVVAGLVEAATETAGPAPAITPVGAGDSEEILARYNQDVQFGKKTVAEAAAEFIAELEAGIESAQ